MSDMRETSWADALAEAERGPTAVLATSRPGAGVLAAGPRREEEDAEGEGFADGDDDLDDEFDDVDDLDDDDEDDEDDLDEDDDDLDDEDDDLDDDDLDDDDGEDDFGDG